MTTPLSVSPPAPASANPLTANQPSYRSSLRPDCANCFALCCTAFGFSRSTDFALDKPAGSPCRNLEVDFSCRIHDRLRPHGFSGCTVFDCFGAGQVVSQGGFAGVSWRDNPASRQDMFSTFRVMRQLHELLWHLSEAQRRTFDPETAQHVGELSAAIESITHNPPAELLALDTAALHTQVRQALMDISEEVRASYLAGNGQLAPELQAGADLIGRNLRSHRLCGAELRGAYLIAADLRGSDLTAVDLLGADLRDARLDGADLSGALYVTQPQLNAASGNASTLLPEGLTTPPHWTDFQPRVHLG